MNPIDTIRHWPEYAALTRARKKIIWPLAAIIIGAYFAFILAIAFAPEALGKPINEGATSVGIALGLAIIFLCFVITGIYVFYANRVLEPLNRAILKRAETLK